MYFPSDMTFQYFFFDTYIGYFLQALPIALLIGTIYGIVRYRKDKATPIYRKVFSCAFNVVLCSFSKLHIEGWKSYA